MSYPVRNKYVHDLNVDRTFHFIIVDDMGEAITEEINSKLDMFAEVYTINRLKNCMKRDEHFLDVEDVDAIFFDATYEEKGESALTILEDLISCDPRYKDIAYVLLGEDVASRRIYDEDTNYLVARAENLPHLLYGGRNGTKTDVIINTITRIAKEKGEVIPKKLPAGTINEELLDLIKPYMEQKDKMIELLKLLKQSLASVAKYDPNNESERQLVKYLKAENTTLFVLAHALGQTTLAMGALLYTDKKLKEKQQSSQDENLQK